MFIKFYTYINNLFNKLADDGEITIRNLYPQLSISYDDSTSEESTIE